MISERFNTIFVHIPKTAGQSIEQVFLDRHGLRWEEREALVLRANKDPQQGPERLAHLYAREYVACGHVSQPAFAAAFKFAVVRNPYDRIVSEYFYRDPRNRPGFPQFVDALSADTNDDLSDFTRHLAPQYKFILGHDGTSLVDTILRFESLEPEFRTVSLKLFGEDVKLPRRNVAPRPADFGLIDQDMRRKIFRHYERDFDLFGYPGALERP
jgi:hypothetical protein